MCMPVRTYIQQDKEHQSYTHMTMSISGLLLLQPFYQILTEFCVHILLQN